MHRARSGEFSLILSYSNSRLTRRPMGVKVQLPADVAAETHRPPRRALEVGAEHARAVQNDVIREQQRLMARSGRASECR